MVTRLHAANVNKLLLGAVSKHKHMYVCSLGNDNKQGFQPIVIYCLHVANL